MEAFNCLHIFIVVTSKTNPVPFRPDCRDKSGWKNKGKNSYNCKILEIKCQGKDC